MDYLIRLSQSHEDFRLAEIKALSVLHSIDLQVIEYDNNVGPYARKLISRSILSQAVFELWGAGSDYGQLHDAVRSGAAHLWPLYKTSSFKFGVDSFRGSRSSKEQVALVNSFAYLALQGKIQMKNPEEEFCIFEEYDLRAPAPKRVLMGRLLGYGARNDSFRYSLKKRRYIATTSMDAELALIGSNLTLARPGSLFYDPFLGTASLTIACSHHGALTLGSDIDGRTVRGKRSNNVLTSYGQYGLAGRYLDGFVSDLTNTPLRLGAIPDQRPIFDGIVCDPPYGVREGLKVLGRADGSKEIKPDSDGRLRHLDDDYIPPKRNYSFDAMMVDILDFAALTLVADGRLSFWIPTANEDESELGIPMHAALELVSVCTQSFGRWSRRLITYRRRRQEEITETPPPKQLWVPAGQTADELNNFRKRYFQGFNPPN